MTTRTKAATVRVGAALENQPAGQRIRFPRARIAHSQPTLPRKITTRPRCARWHCPRPAVATHVAALHGTQERLCARCWRAAREQERVEVARVKLDALFVALRPPATWPGGDNLIVTLVALIGGAERRAA